MLDTHWRTEVHPTLIQVNVDRFKNINDTLGHDAANRLLVRLAERLTEVADSFGGIVARSGGDEFVILDSTTHTQDDALTRAADDRRRAVAPARGRRHADLRDGQHRCRDRTSQSHGLGRRADAPGRHRDPSRQGRRSQPLQSCSTTRCTSNLAHRMEVENALHGAIGRHEMRLYHQPIVDIVTGQISGGSRR